MLAGVMTMKSSDYDFEDNKKTARDFLKRNNP